MAMRILATLELIGFKVRPEASDRRALFRGIVPNAVPLDLEGYKICQSLTAGKY